MNARPLRVVLDARLRDGVAGGIQQFVMGLASGLSRLEDGDEEYWFLSSPTERGWLVPHLAGPCRPLDSVAAALGSRLSLLRRGIDAAAASPLGRLLPVRVPPSDGAVERRGADVMHFTLQGGFRTAVPSIYQPYDLQHVHLPQFFSAYGRKWRDVTYGELCRQARSVVVMSTWVKEDVVRQLRLAPQKVRVIPWAPVTEEYPAPADADLAVARARFGLPPAFAVYPSQTFPHKNHLALLEAVAAARTRGAEVHVVCPGKQSDHFPNIARRARALGVDHLVTFPGYVTPLELRSLYRLATLLVFPSLFEGGGMPVFEAFAAGVPVACSDVTCLPAQAGDAALLFDPRVPGAIAEALLRLWNDPVLRHTLAQRGAERVKRFTWVRTAKTYRALYRHVAQRTLSEEDRALLEAPPDT
jgi:glycosyltransferase involved in cell wall biosynthesis